MQQTTFGNWKKDYSYGGQLRRKRNGRRARPLSTKDPIHLVFKADQELIGVGLRSNKRLPLINELIRKYSRKFFVKVEQVSIQNDHIHFLIRASKRSLLQHFFRVLAGQIAQRFELAELIKDPVTGTPKTARQLNTSLWKHRPWTRIVKGWRAYKTIKDYIQLNEKEAKGEIKYNKRRLKHLTREERNALWR